MLLNRVEKALMNNSLRHWIQRSYEGKVFAKLNGPERIERALEVGCGCGVGAEIVLERFGASGVDAFDLDPEMVDLARRRLGPRGDQVRLWVGDATRIDAEDSTYDAVFDFGIIHHIPDWRGALREIHRVLEPGGSFLTEEVYAAFIMHPLWRRLLDHPLEDRFDHRAYRAALREVGFVIRRERELGPWFGWFAAKKPAPPATR